MKSLSISITIVLSLLLSQFCVAQSLKKETIKVWGNCGMCKKNIEKAAKSAGAATASWNEESKQLKLSYNSSKTSGEKIQDAIAAAGYDTQDKTASDDAYNKLHSCCQYDRKSETTATVENTKCCEMKDCGKDAAHCKEMGCCKNTDGKEKEKSCCTM